MNPMRITTICCAILAAAHFGAIAQTHVARSAAVTTEAAAGLQSKIHEILTQQSGPAWIGYEVPSIKGYQMYCGHPGNHDCTCRLERETETYSQTISSDSGDAAEPSEMFVLLRVKDHRITRVRCFSSGCRLDTGNRPFFLIDDVRPEESIALLKSLIDSPDRGTRDDDDFIGSAIMAIAVHSDPGACTALEGFVVADRPEEVRKQAVFWLGQSGDPRGVEILDRVLGTDESEEVRNQVVFALSCSDAPGALDILVRTAHNDTDPDVRGTALFWLGNKASAKSAEAIKDAVENDPVADVKEKAVFALSQLPKEKGVPLLIDVARTNRSPKVREQAIFWLGQSGDPRALEFFEEVLAR